MHDTRPVDVRTESFDGGVVLHLSGALVQGCLDHVVEGLRILSATHDPDQVTIDCSGVDEIDDAGARVLAQGGRRFGGRAHLIAPPPVWARLADLGERAAHFVPQH